MLNKDLENSATPNWQTFSTSATIVLFFVVGLTGLMLLFKISVGLVKEAHEWLGLIFVLAAVIHTFRHWKAIVRYFRGVHTWGISALVLILCTLFMIPSGGPHREGRRGSGNLIMAIASAPLDKVAQVVGTEAEVLADRLKAEGIEVKNSQESLRQIAERSGRRLPDLMRIAMED
jgi:hypothetical protein